MLDSYAANTASTMHNYFIPFPQTPPIQPKNDEWCANNIPQHEIDNLARVFMPLVLDFYRSEEGQREFAEWKAKREAEKLCKKKAY